MSIECLRKRTRLGQPSPTSRDVEALDRVIARVRQGEAVDARLIEEVAIASFEAGLEAANRNRTPSQGRASGAERDDAVSSDDADFLPPALTPRRLEVLRLVARGLTNDEIGEVLGISRLTVKSHLSSLFASLEVTNRTEAAFAFQRYEAQLDSWSD